MIINKQSILKVFGSIMAIWSLILIFELFSPSQDKSLFLLVNALCLFVFLLCTFCFMVMQFAFLKRNNSLEGTIGELMINSSTPMVITDEYYDIIDFNHGFQDLFSLPEFDAIKEKNIFQLIDLFPKGNQDFSFTLDREKTHWKDNGTAKLAGGSKIDVEIDTNFSKKQKTHVFFINDITRFKAVEYKLNEQIYKDYLTKLPNRKAFLRDFEDFKKEYTRYENIGFNAHLAIIDLDKFSSVNANEGLESGNLVLKDFSSLLNNHIKNENNIYFYHLGGDEFLLFFKNWEKDNVESYMNEIIDLFQCNVQLNDTGYHLSASIGVVNYPKNGKGIDTLFKNCDVSMRYSKKKTGNSYCFFTQKMADLITSRSLLIDGIKKSLENQNGFYLFYQPKIDLSNGSMISVEVLLRWKFENHIVSPSKFIPIAEEAGLSTPIFQFVFEAAIEEIGHMIGSELKSFSVNVSASQLSTPDDIKNLINILEKHQTYAKHITLEITETCIMENIDIALDCLYSIKKMGYRISIDDFGTGYSSLNTMKILPIDELKIDRSFIENIPNNQDEAIVKAIIQMAKSFDFKVVAEGVEEREQIEFLEQTDCDIIQGFYFSKPLDIVGLKRFSSESYH